MATIRPNDLPAAASVPSVSAIIVDTGSAVEKATPAQIVDSAIPLATQAEAQAGTDNTKRVTPLRVAQAIGALGVSAARLASNASGEGAGLVGMDAGGTLEEAVKIVTPLQFGAAGDGVTDDTAAISSALATGADVHFPAGYTFITQGLHEITTSHQRFIVDGTIKYDGVRRFIATGVYGFQGLFRVQDQVEGVTFEGSGVMDGNWRRAGATVDQPLEFRDAGAGIYAYRAIGLKVRGITLQHFSEDGIKTHNCPALDIDATFFDICNVGMEIQSYVDDPRTALPWVGDVYGPSGSVTGFFDWIDDGELFLNFGNGCGVTFNAASGALPVNNLRVGGHYRDCLAAIWSENNYSGSEAQNIIIDAVTIQGNFRGAATASSLQGIGLIGVKSGQVISPVIRNVGNVPPAGGSNSAGLHIVECDGISIINPTITDDTGAADRTQYGIRVNSGTNIDIRGGAISGMATSPIVQVNSPTNVRVESVRGADTDQSWGNLVRYTFALQNVAASSTAKLLVAGEPAAEAAVLVCPGRIVAMSARAGDGQVFAGNYTLQCRSDGVVQAALDLTQAEFSTVSGSSQGISKRASASASQLAAGANLSVIITTDGSWNAGHDIYTDVWVDVGMKA